MTVLGTLFLTMTSGACLSQEAVTVRSSPRIVNLINFIRKCEPHIDWIMEDVLNDTVVEQITIMKQRRLKGTFLLQ